MCLLLWFTPIMLKNPGMLDALDESIGSIVEALDNAGMLEDTIIAFSSDNGGSPYGLQSNRGYNWPLRGAKFTLFEGAIRVPAFVWSSKLAKMPRVSDQLMHISDWLPTLYSAAGKMPYHFCASRHRGHCRIFTFIYFSGCVNVVLVRRRPALKCERARAHSCTRHMVTVLSSSSIQDAKFLTL